MVEIIGQVKIVENYSRNKEKLQAILCKKEMLK